MRTQLAGEPTRVEIIMACAWSEKAQPVMMILRDEVRMV